MYYSCSMRTRLLFCFLLLPLAALAGQAQPTDEVVARWQAGQERAARRVSAITCVEESNRRLDGPSGTREILTVSRLHMGLGEEHLKRELLRVEMNGRPVPEREQHRVVRYLQHGRRDGAALADVLYAPALLAALRPEGVPRPDALADGALRLDLLAPPPHPVERVTLWFTPRGDRLVRSRLLARHRPDDAPLVVETEYRRRGGLDVPHHRHVEGSVLVRKRSRTFTMLYDQQIAYRDYRFERSKD